MQKIWFITGISSGLGRALAEQVLENGDVVIGTFRQPADRDVFQKTHPDRALGLLLDVAKPEGIKAAFRMVEEKFGRLDVLVNNAGAGYLGAVEESSLEDARKIFDVNVFGALAVTQHALPLFRRQRSGHILQISSGAGIRGTAGFGIYNASKFALEGFSEALTEEVRPLGIHVIIVEPGPFRTDFAGRSIFHAPVHIDDYAPTAGAFRQRMAKVDGQQEGDPVKAARIMMEVVTHAEPPLRLPLGRLVLANIQAKIDKVQSDLDAWRDIAATAVY